MQQDSPDSKTVFTHLSLFFGGPGQDWGRDFMGEANTIVGQLSVTHLLYTVQDLFCAARQPRFQNSFHTPLFVFWWTRSRLRKRLYGWSQHHSGSVISHPSLVHSSRSVLCSKTAQIPKQFSHTSLCFLVDQVKTEEETLWVKPIP